MDTIREKWYFKCSLFFLCAATLLSGGFMYILTSCEGEDDVSGNGRKDPPPSTGEMVTINFTVGERSLGISDVVVHNTASPNPFEGGELGGASILISPPSRESEGASLYLYSTLLEDEIPVKLRSSLLEPNIKVRVVAYTNAGSGYTTKQDHADYVIDGFGSLVLYGTPPLSVPSGSIKFVAYSFNDTITMLPFTDITAPVADSDLLWGDTIVTVDPTHMNVHIMLDHLFSRIKLRATVAPTVGNDIDAIGIARFTHTFPTLTVQSGVLTPGTSVTIPFTWPATGSASFWESDYHPVYTNGGPPKLEIGNVMIDSNPYPGLWPVNFATSLETGKQYTLNVNFKRASVFSVYWYGANFLPTGGPWSVTRYSDETDDYIFPWNTTETDIDVVSNIGCDIDYVPSSFGSETVTLGSSFTSGGNTVYPYTFSFNNTNYTSPATYSLKFVSNPVEEDVTRSFRRGIQQWTLSPTIDVTAGYKGTTAAPDTRTITNNLLWSYWFDNWNPASSINWARAGAGASGNLYAPIQSSPMQQDDRLDAPEAYSGTYPASGVLTTATTYRIVTDAASGPILLAPTIDPGITRTVKLSFKNETGGSSLSNINVTQYRPRAWVVSHTGSPQFATWPVFTTSGMIPITGGTYTFNISTNVTNLGIRVYIGGGGGVLLSSTTVSADNDRSGSNVQLTVTIPQNNSLFRTLEFYFYSTDPPLSGTNNEVKFAEVIQNGTLIIESGVAAPRIFVYGSGENARLMLTQRPTNFGAFFQFGGIIGWTWVPYGVDSPANFNPTTTISSMWSSSWSTGVDYGQNVQHNNAKLKNGVGDPCRLLGFTQAQIKDLLTNDITPDNGSWRTPTAAELTAWAINGQRGASVDGVVGWYFGPANNRQFMPYNGYRSSTGSWGLQTRPEYVQNGSGAYWDNTICGVHYYPEGLHFNQAELFIHPESRQPAAFGVRCIPQ